VQGACALLSRAGPPAPARFEFAGYHQRAGARVVGVFAADPACPAVEARLSAADRRRKTAALARFETQAPVLAWFPVGTERWRPAPTYDFRRPPPPGACLYDGFGWPLDGEAWRAQARTALAELEAAP
jgi:hypothetical protein